MSKTVQLAYVKFTVPKHFMLLCTEPKFMLRRVESVAVTVCLSKPVSTAAICAKRQYPQAAVVLRVP